MSEFPSFLAMDDRLPSISWVRRRWHIQSAERERFLELFQKHWLYRWRLGALANIRHGLPIALKSFWEYHHLCVQIDIPYVHARIAQLNYSREAGQGPCPLKNLSQGWEKISGKSVNNCEPALHPEFGTESMQWPQKQEIRRLGKTLRKAQNNWLSPCERGGKAQ